MGKNVAVFVDVANIFYAAKAAGVDIDYVTLLKSATAGRDLVRAYAYTGLDPDNENQRNFHDFLRRSNYKVVSKDIRKYGDGKVKANLDIELVVDMMKTARNLDIAIVVSGDGDFAPAIRAVQEQGVRVEVISFRGNTSSDLIEVADQFTDIVQLARVEKGSRSGRRVADDGDLSMTEVPDKQTEGTGVGRGRGMRGGRGRGRSEDAVAAVGGRERERSRGRGRAAAPARDAATGDGLVALPGERLSRAGGLSEADLAAAEVFTLDDLDAPLGADDGQAPDVDRVPFDGDDADGPRRRRRRGGRGRGRGRGREDGLTEDVVAGEAGEADAPLERDGDELVPVAAADIEEEAPQGADEETAEDELDDVPVTERRAPAAARRRAPVEDVAPAPRAPRTTPFGSVWDSQLGTSAAPANLGPIAEDDEDFDEPEIPEYLIAEQRRGNANARGGRGGGARSGPRGGRSAYQSAMERERFGGRGGGGGINRYPDVSGRTGTPSPGRGGQPPREDRAPREERPPRRDRDDRPRVERAGAPRSSDAPRPTSSEPWSEVPPELEAMLRAQVGAPAPRPTATPAPSRDAEAPGGPDEVVPEAADAATDPVDTGAAAAPKRRTTRRTATAVAEAVGGEASPVAAAEVQPPAAPKRRTTRKAAGAEPVEGSDATGAPVSDAAAGAEPAAAPKRRTTRTSKTATTAPTADVPPDGAADDATTEAGPAPAPKRRTTRKAAAPTDTSDPA